MTLRAILVLAVCLQIPCAASAQIFYGADAGGTTVLSNFRTASTPDLLIAPAPRAVDAPAAVVSDKSTTANAEAAGAARWHPLIRSVANESGLAPELLHAVIAVESGFDARAVSRKGAQGLMQLMPATARRFGVSDPFDPRQNVAGGAAYLKWLLDKFDGKLTLALAAYNAGEEAVVRAGNRIPPYDETRAYVPRVLALLRNKSLY